MLKEAMRRLLADKIVLVTGCWVRRNWKSNQYARISVRGVRVKAHRLVASVKFHRPISSPFLVCHKCDNPPCFNPSHLFVGTSRDNVNDAIKKYGKCGGAGAKTRICKYGHDKGRLGAKCSECNKRRCAKWQGKNRKRRA